MNIEIGQMRKFKNTLPDQWFGKPYPETIAGQVTKVYKNGRIGLRIKTNFGSRVVHVYVANTDAA